jgi:hypothetical protein
MWRHWLNLRCRGRLPKGELLKRERAALMRGLFYCQGGEGVSRRILKGECVEFGA